jgi:hypothetical protein
LIAALLVESTGDTRHSCDHHLRKHVRGPWYQPIVLIAAPRGCSLHQKQIKTLKMYQKAEQQTWT